MVFKSDTVKQWAMELGFSLVGITPSVPGDDVDRLLAYLEEGRHGQMAYMENYLAKRMDPRELVENAKSVICLAVNYYQSDPVDKPVHCGQVARYAWGRDYHKILKKRLKQLAMKISEKAEMKFRCFVDSGPILEKSFAARAGLGWIGKNNLLINGKYGSWLVLGEIVTDLEFDVYDEPVNDGCCDCQKCIEACPSQALTPDRKLDARRCISYWTVEANEEMPDDIKAVAGNRFFGCDICQEVCPCNSAPVICKDREIKICHAYVDLDELARLDNEQKKEKFAGSCLRRALGKK
ncbi:MAG: tRNA epoxyqueuosine(34) reductase QueG [Phycisphaerae bacterium]|nr:tRNA epoxyqueuosine(34) reductase QueG [Phycisphaerae bacterium]